LPQAQSLRDHPLFEPLRSERGRRVVGLIAALLIEAILLIVLLTLNIHDEPDAAPGSLTVVDLKAQDDSPDESEQAAQKPSESAPQFEQRTEPSDPQIGRPEAVQPDVVPPTQPVPQPVIPSPFQLPTPSQPARPAQPAAPKQVYGPVDTGSRSGVADSEVVGTAPDGQPLYAARWYREPDDSELAGYLSTASGPGWGLIACKTAPEFRVIDCVPLSEYPQGSMINRAVLAAAWQFRVRPPRRGGKSLVGSWVRIRIDYTDRR
jgi:periplasmic protein TonB